MAQISQGLRPQVNKRSLDLAGDDGSFAIVRRYRRSGRSVGRRDCRPSRYSRQAPELSTSARARRALAGFDQAVPVPAHRAVPPRRRRRRSEPDSLPNVSLKRRVKTPRLAHGNLGLNRTLNTALNGCTNGYLALHFVLDAPNVAASRTISSSNPWQSSVPSSISPIRWTR